MDFMTQEDVEAFVSALENVHREENYGYSFFFVGEDHRLPFVTIANSDSDYDNASNLSRDGVFRINIGISKTTFDSLLGDYDPEKVDYTVLNTVLPHPDYAKQSFVCILNPVGDNVEATKNLIREAHSIAAQRDQKLQRRTD